MIYNTNIGVIMISTILSIVLTTPAISVTENIYNNCASSVVQIMYVEPVTDKPVDTTPMCIGTGFLVKSKESGQLDVITAKHVVSDPGTYSAVMKDGTVLQFKRMHLLKNCDVAIIDVINRKWNVKGLVLTNTRANVGSDIFVIGHPIGLSWIITQGNANGYRSPEDNPLSTYLCFTTPIWFGNSGGPIINKNGSVVGVVSWMYTGPRHLNFGVPSYEVLKELAGFKW